MRKRLVSLAAIAAVSFGMVGCTATSTVTENGEVGRSAGYQIITDWTTLPSENEYVTDVYVRIVKIENICYTQTGSAYDWQVSLIPMGATC